MKKEDLKSLSKEELVDLLNELSKLDKKNESFLKSKLSSDFEDLFKQSCKKIDDAFSCYELMSLKNARQALNDFKKSKPDRSQLIELYLYYIKRAYELEKTDWRFQENFYLAIESVFSMIVDIIKENPHLKDKYNERIRDVIKNANEGWSHKETLEEMYDIIE